MSPQTDGHVPEAPRRAPDPLRETRVLRHYVQAGVYGLLALFLPVQTLLVGMPLKWALTSDALFIGLATLAIEGAFMAGRLIRKRVAYPTAILFEMRETKTLAEASCRAASTIAQLFALDAAVLLVRGHGDSDQICAGLIPPEEAAEIIESHRPSIEAAHSSRAVVRAGSKDRPLIVIPLMGAADVVGAVIMRGTQSSDLKDLQTLQNVGSRLGIYLETLWQKEELARREAHSQALLTAIPDAMLRIKRDGTITYFVSPNAQETRTIVQDNPVGSNLYEMLPPAVTSEIATRIQRVLNSGDLEQFEFELPVRSGISYREARIVPVAPDEVLAIVRDIGDRRRAQDTLREREEYFRLLIENAHDAIVVISSGGVVKYASPALNRLLGYGPEELVGSDAMVLIEPEDREGLLHIFATPPQGQGAAQSAEFRARHRDGSWRVIEATARPLTPGASDSDVVVNGRDVTDRRRAADVLSESEQRMRTIFEEAPIGMAVVSPEMKPLRVNKALQEMLGYSEDEIKARGIVAVSHPDDVEEDTALAKRLVDGEITGYRLEKRYITRDGATMWGDLTATVIRGPNGEILYGLGMIENITDRKRAEETVRHLAFHDALTGLPNRALFRDRLELAVVQARRSQQTAAVMFLDLDRFKMVNDSVGHAEGDQLLREVAEKISGVVREGDTVARVGGDEFTILLPTIERMQDAVLIADRILKALADPFTLAGKEFLVSGSIGITIIPDDGDDADSLLRNADIAMYRAKEQGRNQYQLYAPHMNEVIVERIAFEASLRHAIDQNEFILHYQPQFDVQTMEVTGVEALVRWRRADGTIMPPAQFIPLAEETGLIIPLGQWVLRNACEQARAWQDAGLPPARVAVNMSAREFQSPDLATHIQSVLEETGLDPSLLQVEITEGVAMEHADLAIGTLRQLKRMGVQLALDDFGIGYSSLAYLKRFPIDVLKIDCSFVRNVGTDPADTALVGAIITMAHSMGIRVIAEGVESVDQLEFLRDPRIVSVTARGAGCDEFQGFLVSRPVEASEVEPLLRAGKGVAEIPSAAA